ncbi:MAG TPA: glycosyltransferase family 39 protein [Gemmatimonadaceae bacterium]
MLVAAVVLVLAIHAAAVAVTPYELHRDEFLYLAMGEHLRLWRMDFPPAIAILSRLVRATTGVGLVAVRMVPAVVSAIVVAFAALFARELGGRRFAQALAALAVIASPAFLRVGTLYQPVVLDQLAWTLVLFALVRLARTRDARWWIALGVAGGLGLLVKFSIGIIGAGLALALVLLPERRWLGTRWPYLAALLALLIGSPSIIGQIRTGWPAVAYQRDLATEQLSRVTVLGFFGGQLRMLGPALLVALAGVWELLRRPPLRIVAASCLGALAILLALHGKAYYLLPVYPALLGAGAAYTERASATLARGRTSAVVAARGAVVVAVVAYGAISLPFGLPVLPPAQMARYAALGSDRYVTTNTGRVLRLPQDYADMLHWRERVAAVARVYESLPPAERRRAVIAADNYGEAGAIDYYGPSMGLPHAICGCGTYWFFGPGDKPGDVLLSVGIDEHDLRRFYRSVRPAGRIVDPWTVPEEQDIRLYVATRPTTTLQRIWPSLDPRRTPDIRAPSAVGAAR